MNMLSIPVLVQCPINSQSMVSQSPFTPCSMVQSVPIIWSFNGHSVPYKGLYKLVQCSVDSHSAVSQRSFSGHPDPIQGSFSFCSAPVQRPFSGRSVSLYLNMFMLIQWSINPSVDPFFHSFFANFVLKKS